MEQCPRMVSFPNRILLAAAMALLVASCGGGGGGSSPQTVSSFTISGTISAPSGTVSDSDVNDPEAPFTRNDACDEAQTIPNPVLVGGYVNLPGAGASGVSQVSGDVSDFYRVSLTAGQVLRLEIADQPDPNPQDPDPGSDLDLYVDLDRDGIAEDTANTGAPGEAETITVTGAGDACVEVEITSGASSYVLTIGQSATSVATSADIAQEFVPGDVIVKFRDDQPAASRAVRAASLGLEGVAGADRHPMLMRMQAKHARAAMHKKLQMTSGDKRSLQFARDPVRAEKWETLRVIKALRARADVEYAEPNYIRRAFAVPNDPLYARQWHYPLINLPQAWDAVGGLSNAGAGVTVAVIDTGVVLTHPDLASNINTANDFDFISDVNSALDGNGPDNNATDPGDELSGGSSFHGTHVAGTIAAVTHNTNLVAGVAGAATILPLRVLGAGGAGTSFDIQEAVKYAAGLSSVGGGAVPSPRAQIINLSLGGPGSSQSEQSIYTQAHDRGVIIIAAAGNENTSTPSFPASYDDVVSVSAVNINKTRAFYSNFGSFIDVAAPGGDATKDLNGDGFPDGVMSTRADDSTGSVVPTADILMGTSMAAPHVAGVAALMKQQDPGMTPDDFDALLASGSLTQDIDAAGSDDDFDFGHGLIDASKAVAAAGSGVIPDVLVVNPAGLNFGVSGISATLSAVNGGSGSLTVTGVSADQPWITVSSLAPPGLGTYTITANRNHPSVLANGTYTAKITFTTNLPSPVTVNVIMQQLAASPGANAGRHYILLLDQDFNIVDGAAANAVNGQYTFSFGGRSAGDYFVIAGSDSNNDNFICDPGEACGAWPTLAQFDAITVGPSATGVNFFTGFETSVSGQVATSSATRPVFPRSGFRRIAE